MPIVIRDQARPGELLSLGVQQKTLISMDSVTDHVGLSVRPFEKGRQLVGFETCSHFPIF
jgi:hypothetical protein